MNQIEKKSLLSRVLRKMTGGWVRVVDFHIMRRPMSLPNYKIPKGKRPPFDFEADQDYMYNPTHEHIDSLEGHFPAEKLKIFHQAIDNDAIDFILRLMPEGGLWGYMMHALKPMKDIEYGFRIPIIPGKESLQFDGWVHPDHRGMLIAIEGSNWMLDRRRKTGHEAIVVAVRSHDRPAVKYHQRFGYEKVGSIRHYRVGPMRFNKMKMDNRS
jgi:hypothetical protein